MQRRTAASGWAASDSGPQCSTSEIDGLLAVAGYRVRSSDLLHVAHSLERLESVTGGVPADHLASTEAVHYNSSDLTAEDVDIHVPCSTPGWSRGWECPRQSRRRRGRKRRKGREAAGKGEGPKGIGRVSTGFHLVQRVAVQPGGSTGFFSGFKYNRVQRVKKRLRRRQRGIHDEVLLTLVPHRKR